MKLYRVRYSHEGGTSVGYGWFASRSAADRGVAAFRRTTKDEDGEASVDLVEVSTLSKRAVLELLNRYATYPDNG